MEGTLQSVSLADINDTVGTPPSERLRKSVTEFGIIQPVLLAEQTNEDGEIHFAIVDGNRRIAAARAARIQYVPAIVMTGMSPADVAHFTLVANGFRTANYLTEFWAIKALERNHVSYKDILGVSGMANSSIKLRNQLSGLNRDLLIALRNGQINQSVATTAAKHDPQAQEVLANHFRSNKRLTQSDIKNLVPPLETESSGEEPSVQESLQAAVKAAKDQGITKEAFLQMASQEWDQ